MLGKVPTDILRKLSDSTNDSEKFAHLLLLTKAVKPDSMTPEFGYCEGVFVTRPNSVYDRDNSDLPIY